MSDIKLKNNTPSITRKAKQFWSFHFNPFGHIYIQNLKDALLTLYLFI